MDKVLYRPTKIKRYLQEDLRNVKVQYDSEGYPINPDTKERVIVIADEFLFVFNLLFLFFWPCLMIRRCAAKTVEMKRNLQKKKAEKDDFPKKIMRKREKDTSKHTDSSNLRDDKGQKKGKSKHHSPELKSKDQEETYKSGFYQPETPINYEDEEPVSAGPVGQPMTKERERWTKGQRRVQAVTK